MIGAFSVVAGFKDSVRISLMPSGTYFRELMRSF